MLGKGMYARPKGICLIQAGLHTIMFPSDSIGAILGIHGPSSARLNGRVLQSNRWPNGVCCLLQKESVTDKSHYDTKTNAVDQYYGQFSNYIRMLPQTIS
jgi:hypothetical protein